MEVTEIRCDRCEDVIPSSREAFKLSTFCKKLDLCSNCVIAFDRFMENQDQVGDFVFREVDGPCPHHIGCAYPYPCTTTIWEPQDR